MASDSTIGAGTVVRGSVRGDGDLSIHGRVEGSVTVSGELLIGESALIRSDLSARRVVVRGAVLGSISAEEAIILEPGARVLGDLGAPQIGIRPGGLVRGNVSTEGPLSLAAAATVDAGRLRTSPKAASVTTAAVARAAPPAPRAAAAPAGRAAPAGPAPARQAPPRPAPARQPTQPIARTLAPPAQQREHAAPQTTASRLEAPSRVDTPRADASRADAPRAETPARAEGEPSLPGAASSPATRVDVALSAPSTAPSVPGRPASIAVGSLDEHDEDATSLGEPDDTGGGPPPPVVPALRKGAKASLRRKGAR